MSANDRVLKTAVQGLAGIGVMAAGSITIGASLGAGIVLLVIGGLVALAAVFGKFFA
jgi:hypothetical protein